MNILILNTKILAIDPQDSGDSWQTVDQVIPKHVVPGATLVTVDSLPADYAPGLYNYNNGFVPVPVDGAVLAAKKAELTLKIDADADALIAQVIGQRGLEYLEAEKQAAAYIAANYLGTVPPYVQNWATVKGQTSQWAANNIATTAAAWRNASDSLRFSRLQHKENTQNATSIAGLDTIQASWLAFLAGLKQSLGV